MENQLKLYLESEEFDSLLKEKLPDKIETLIKKEVKKSITNYVIELSKSYPSIPADFFGGLKNYILKEKYAYLDDIIDWIYKKYQIKPNKQTLKMILLKEGFSIRIAGEKRKNAAFYNS